MSNVTDARIAEIDLEMERWQAACLEYFRSGKEGQLPTPPVLSPQEQLAWSETFRGRILARMVDASGGQAAWDQLQAQSEAIKHASNEADRSTVIVHASVVEDQLKSAIERYFPGKEKDPESIERLFNPMKYGPLGSFTARVDVAFALGVVGVGGRRCLKQIASIRNLFAHRLDIHSFDHPEVSKLVGKLDYINFAITGPDADGLIYLWSRTPGSEVKAGHRYRVTDDPFDPRGKFEKTCQFLQNALRVCKPDLPHPDLHEDDF